MIEAGACRIPWNDGTSGLWMLEGDSLSVAYLIRGKLGLGVCEVRPDGPLDGLVVDDLHSGGLGKGGHLGRETLTPMR